MYHALSRGQVPPGQDPHYTLDEKRFREQLQQVVAAGGACSAQAWLHDGERRPVLLTFDDGHASNYELAFPALVEHAMRADFFVNPGNVGKPGFASWAQLREMDAAGMSIQSHGYDHVYLTGLGRDALRERLHAARIAIEDGIGSAVTLLAPPGGRMPAGLVGVARQCGYRHVLSSRPGRLPSSPGTAIVPRLAITAAVDARRFHAWVRGARTAILREQLRHGSLWLAKGVLGDSRYERARMLALAGRRS
jgi:peptidoglycan/xylan/chitin deacetylase (PgdA/CDA1 family)